jgi:PGF-CTERM protein
MRIRSAILTAVLVVSLIGAAAAPAATQGAEAEGYSGAFIEFETADAAVNDYTVSGQVVVDSLRVQSAGEAGGSGEGGVGVGVGADSTVSIDGAAVQSQNSGAARASVAFESGAQLEANDNRRGVVRITADGGDQVIQANVSGDASQEGDGRVVVSGDDGAQGTFIVVGEGNVSANGDGQVTAAVGEGGQVVYRQYDGERSDSEQQQEQLIQDGTAAAELFVRGAADSEGGSDGGDNETSVVTYDEDTSAEVTSRSESQINATVDRTQQQGKVVVVTVAESAVQSAESLEVLIDGEAAAQADSYGEVQQSAEEGDEPRYLVRQSSSAEAAVDVVVGIDGFSERQLSIQDADDGESTPTDMGNGDNETDGDGETDTDGDDGSSADGPGFGALAALIALTAALVAAAARRR